MRKPLPVGGAWQKTPPRLWITFDEQIQLAPTSLGALTVEGTIAAAKQQSTPNGRPDGRRVEWTTLPILGANDPPLRVTYSDVISRIVGVGGGEVDSFADFPLTHL